MGWRLRDGGHEGASWNVREVKHKATLDGHNSSIFRAEFLKGDESTKTLSTNLNHLRILNNSFSDNLLLSVGNDRTFKVWDLEKLVCLHESPSVGQFSLTAAALHINPPERGGAAVLALGNCEGKISFFNIIQAW